MAASKAERSFDSALITGIRGFYWRTFAWPGGWQPPASRYRSGDPSHDRTRLSSVTWHSYSLAFPMGHAPSSWYSDNNCLIVSALE